MNLAKRTMFCLLPALVVLSSIGSYAGAQKKQNKDECVCPTYSEIPLTVVVDKYSSIDSEKCDQILHRAFEEFEKKFNLYFKIERTVELDIPSFNLTSTELRAMLDQELCDSNYKIIITDYLPECSKIAKLINDCKEYKTILGAGNNFYHFLVLFGAKEQFKVYKGFFYNQAVEVAKHETGHLLGLPDEEIDSSLTMYRYALERVGKWSKENRRAICAFLQSLALENAKKMTLAQ